MKACVDLFALKRAERVEERRNRHADFVTFAVSDEEMKEQIRNPHVFCVIVLEEKRNRHADFVNSAENGEEI